MTEQVLMEEMSWAQIKEAIDGGKNVVVFACGAVEQHGPHLPTGTDAFLGTATAERAARMAGNALVAPTIRPGLSQHHMHFPGSLSLRPETFLALLQDYCVSLACHGFRRIVMFPSHGGNVDMMKAHLPYIAHSLDGKAEVRLALRAAVDFERAITFAAEKGISAGRAGVHAGYLETSMMLAYRPSTVTMERAEPGRHDEEFFLPENLQRSQMESFLYGVHQQSPNGILGDPTGANAEVGNILLDMAATALLRELAGQVQLAAAEESGR